MPTPKNQKLSELLGQAAHFLKYRSRSRFELERYLSKKTQNPELVNRSLKQLEELGLINDTKFAQDFSRAKLNKLFGPTIIQYQLKSKFHLDSQTINQALNQINSEQWLFAATKYLKKQLSKIAKKPKWQAKHLAYQHLYKRGFSQETITSAIDEIGLSE